MTTHNIIFKKGFWREENSDVREQCPFSLKNRVFHFLHLLNNSRINVWPGRMEPFLRVPSAGYKRDLHQVQRFGWTWIFIFRRFLRSRTKTKNKHSFCKIMHRLGGGFKHTSNKAWSITSRLFSWPTRLIISTGIRRGHQIIFCDRPKQFMCICHVSWGFFFNKYE